MDLSFPLSERNKKKLTKKSKKRLRKKSLKCRDPKNLQRAREREIVICIANGSSKFSIITSPHQWPMRPKRPHRKYDFSFRKILFFRSSLFCLLDFLASLGTIWLGGWRECLYCFLYVHHPPLSPIAKTK